MNAAREASPAPEIRRLLEQALDDQKSSWSRGERIAVEVYLERHPEIRTDAEAVLDLIYQEYLLRRERGETPEPDEFYTRFPDLAESLMLQFGVDSAIQLAKTPQAENDSSDGNVDDPLKAIEGYELITVLGRGGMGVVYKARDVKLGRIVALKTIAEVQYAIPEQRDRFQSEAHAIARLHHPNIISIHAIGEHGTRPYLSLEFAEGGSLAQRLAEKPMATGDAAGLVETLAHAVQAAHQAGVVHRDLKPSNVLLTADGVFKVSDFGLAKLLDTDSARTLSGQVMGTQSYMAPEQAEGHSKQVGPPADIYALGAILYQALTGRPPFLGESQLETIKLVTSTEVVSPHLLRPDVPRDLETICLKCLEKSPGKRYATALDLAEDLGRFQRGEAILARRLGALQRSWKWARRHPWQTTSAALVLVAVSAFFGLTYRHNLELRAEIGRTQATAASGLVQQLFKVDTPQIPGIVQAIGGYRRWTDPELRKAAEASSADLKVKLHASLALLPVDPTQVSYLQTRLLHAGPGELPVLREALQPYRADLTPALWTALESAGLEDPRLLPAAGALALYDSESPRWAVLGEKVAEALLTVNSLVLGPWLEALRPVRGKLTAPLEAILRDKNRSETTQSVATDILADYAGDDPGLLAELLMVSSPKAYRTFFPMADRYFEGVLPAFQAEIARKPEPAWNDPPIDPSWTKPDPALMGQLESAQGLLADRFAFCQTMPLGEFLIVTEELRKSGFRPIRFRPYADGQEVRVAAIWTRDRRRWRMASGLSANGVREQNETNRQDQLIPVDVAGYVATDAQGKPADRYGVLWVERANPHEEARMIVGETFVDLTAVQKRLMGESLIGRSMNAFRSAGGRVRCNGVFGRSQSLVPPPGWFHYWGESEQSLRQRQLPDSDFIFFDVTIHAVEMPTVGGEIARARIVAAEQRLVLNPHDRDARFVRALAFIRLGEVRKALVDLDALVSEAPPDSVAGYQCSRAIVHARLGHKREALYDLAKAQKGNVSASGKFSTAAAVAAELGEGERDAFEHLESALKENPVIPNSITTLAVRIRWLRRRSLARTNPGAGFTPSERLSYSAWRSGTGSAINTTWSMTRTWIRSATCLVLLTL